MIGKKSEIFCQPIIKEHLNKFLRISNKNEYNHINNIFVCKNHAFGVWKGKSNTSSYLKTLALMLKISLLVSGMSYQIIGAKCQLKSLIDNINEK